ncbi:latent-transforming growth factor beta-binding protein 1 [Lingula anatina]|uniref:Latent-transforming growth factor beta-binding protein 1 n=1 Tax=Lingula anatina TaxID=7574 RepID=A0A1S3KE30_LINAN|nr:latent-transforming growth factor beta-binding protein 1 [Lingula anatina]|eukprot:XP_013420885.1 latent-transforming growth factor beta-binding protein 1 [Lingula anatina]
MKVFTAISLILIICLVLSDIAYAPKKRGKHKYRYHVHRSHHSKAYVPLSALSTCYCNKNPCATNNGGCEDLCVNTYAGHYCACSPGFQLVAGENDTTSCDYDVSCVALDALNGQLVCICEDPIGRYPVNGTRCQDRDECQEDSPCQSKCTNTIGSFECGCAVGFELSNDSRTCVDIDECVHNNTCTDGLCINTPGSVTCFRIASLISGRKKRETTNTGPGEDVLDYDLNFDVNVDNRGGFTEAQLPVRDKIQQSWSRVQEKMDSLPVSQIETQGCWQSVIYLCISVISIFMSLVLLKRVERAERAIQKLTS